MARNQEKAQALLNRFVQAKTAANREDKSTRPYLATECEDLRDCELYRAQIIKEMSKKVSLIQNEGLEEHKVRDLNDSINKLFREKGHWERQIKALGGADHFRTAPKMFSEEEAEEVVPGRGYRYFGAAKKLPGVKELFSKAAPEREKRTRFEMLKSIDADYYGYRDDDDGILMELERGAEEQTLAKLSDDFREAQRQRREANPDGVSDEEEEVDEDAAARLDAFVAHVEVPDQDAIKSAVLARRKQALLEQLGGEDGGRGVELQRETYEPEKPLLPASW